MALPLTQEEPPSCHGTSVTRLALAIVSFPSPAMGLRNTISSVSVSSVVAPSVRDTIPIQARLHMYAHARASSRSLWLRVQRHTGTSVHAFCVAVDLVVVPTHLLEMVGTSTGIHTDLHVLWFQSSGVPRQILRSLRSYPISIAAWPSQVCLRLRWSADP